MYCTLDVCSDNRIRQNETMLIDSIESSDLTSSKKYIRYISGLQICWFLISNTGHETEPSMIVTLPVAFKDTSYVVSAIDSGSKKLDIGIVNSSTSSLEIFAYNNGSGYGIKVFCIGTWK